jgi:FtsH-binding integral membrane protein
MSEMHVDKGFCKFLSSVYQYVGLNLLWAGAIAFFVSTNSFCLQLIFGTPLRYVMLIMPILISGYIGANISTLSLSAVQVLYWVYGGIIGASLSPIFLIYTSESIATCFIITGAVCLAAGLYGKATNQDLSSIGATLSIVVFGLFIVSCFNFIMQSASVQYIVSCLVVIVFPIMIAYTVQRLQNIYYSYADNVTESFAILGALHIFISFVNIFVHLLYLIGKKR